MGRCRLEFINIASQNIPVLRTLATHDDDRADDDDMNILPGVLFLGCADSETGTGLKLIAEGCIKEMEGLYTNSEILENSWCASLRRSCRGGSGKESFAKAIEKCFANYGMVRKRKILELVEEAIEVCDIIANVCYWSD